MKEYVRDWRCCYWTCGSWGRQLQAQPICDAPAPPPFSELTSHRCTCTCIALYFQWHNISNSHSGSAVQFMFTQSNSAICLMKRIWATTPLTNIELPSSSSPSPPTSPSSLTTPSPPSSSSPSSSPPWSQNAFSSLSCPASPAPAQLTRSYLQPCVTPAPSAHHSISTRIIQYF